MATTLSCCGGLAVKTVESRHIAKRTSASLRASATTATREPRRAAIPAAQSCSDAFAPFFLRRMHYAASTSMCRALPGPAFEMCPRCCCSPELRSEGTSPK